MNAVTVSMDLIPTFGVEERQSAIMASKKTRLQIVSRGVQSSHRKTANGDGDRYKSVATSAHPRVSARWLFSAVALVIAAAAVCVWSVLCLLFWQGSWQLLYHPAAAVTRTPADAGLTFDSVTFATTDAGVAKLSGWWIPADAHTPYGRFTFTYLHSQDGNLGDTVDALARLHAAGVNVLAFDYRGYGKSVFSRPSETHWREDAEWAVEYLVQTRHINPATIVLDGTGLGANVALEVAAEHAALAGVVMNSPSTAPINAVFNDPRARLVPARLLNHDRYDLMHPAGELRIPLLWFTPTAPAGHGSETREPEPYQKVNSPKMLVWLDGSGIESKQYRNALGRWLDSLPVH